MIGATTAGLLTFLGMVLAQCAWICFEPTAHFKVGRVRSVLMFLRAIPGIRPQSQHFCGAGSSHSLEKFAFAVVDSLFVV